MSAVGAPVHLEVPLTTPHTYITTTIPYVNARPHLGFALELVQADVLARHHRRHGEQVRFQTGTDDNSLKNVLAAQAAGVGVQEFVDGNAATFTALAGPLSLSVDDVIRTSRDPRHRSGVERLWQACADAGDLYRKHYEGLYCVGCEQFYTPAELNEGRCPEHGTQPQQVSEENWFFRLSRYTGHLHNLIATGALRIEPAERRNEVLAFIAGGLEDFSISRSTDRARGWGIPVPGDPSQVIYVWWDALGNYLTALGYGTGSDDLPALVDRGRAPHPPGRQGSAPFPRRLLARHAALGRTGTADRHPGARLPHRRRTQDQQIQRPDRRPGHARRPVRHRRRPLVAAARSAPRRRRRLHPRRLINRANDELANGLGNLVNRAIAMIHRYRSGHAPATRASAPDAEALDRGHRAGARPHRRGSGRLRLRRATAAVWHIVDEANRYINHIRPWDLARTERTGNQHTRRDLDTVLATLLRTCQTIGEHLTPFLPDAATRIIQQCTSLDGQLPAPSPLLRRLAAPDQRKGRNPTNQHATTDLPNEAAGHTAPGHRP